MLIINGFEISFVDNQVIASMLNKQLRLFFNSFDEALEALLAL